MDDSLRQRLYALYAAIAAGQIDDALQFFDDSVVMTRACLQLSRLCTRTDQNQTRNTVLFCSVAGTLGIPKSVVE